MLVGPQRAVIQRQRLRLVLERVLGVGERGHARNERHALLLRQLRDQLVDLLDVQNCRLCRAGNGGGVVEASEDALDVYHDGVIIVRLRERRAHLIDAGGEHGGRDIIAGEFCCLRGVAVFLRCSVQHRVERKIFIGYSRLRRARCGQMLLVVQMRARVVVGHKSAEIDKPADNQRQNAKQDGKCGEKRPLEKPLVAIGKNAQSRRLLFLTPAPPLHGTSRPAAGSRESACRLFPARREPRKGACLKCRSR